MVTICDTLATGGAFDRQEARVTPGSSLSQRLPKLILASQSPRRRQLLTEYGLSHEAINPGVDDGTLHPGHVSAGQWVASLAFLKASAGADALRWSVWRDQPTLVIGADTVCVKNDDFIGQPRDEADAERILRTLQKGSHEVVTGVALLSLTPGKGSRREVLVDRAQVHVGDIGDDRIRAYLDSGQWRGKAGAYNLGERIEAGWPIEYDGDPTTVMGLPMRALIGRLNQIAAGAPCAGPLGGSGTLRLEQSPDA